MTKELSRKCSENSEKSIRYFSVIFVEILKKIGGIFEKAAKILKIFEKTFKTLE